MAQKGKPTYPPRKLPGLITVPTGETIVYQGKIYRVLKLVREKAYI